MENNSQIDSFLKQSLIDKDNNLPVVPQNLENKIFQQFRDSSKKNKFNFLPFNLIQRIAAMLVLFFGGILTGWWLNVPHDQKNHVSSVQPVSKNPVTKIAVSPEIQKPVTKNMTEKQAVLVKNDPQKRVVKFDINGTKNTEINHPNKANEVIENQIELPSIVTLISPQYEKLKFLKDKAQLPNSENQRTREMIQVFQFVAL